jgi:DNA adenine methylase
VPKGTKDSVLLNTDDFYGISCLLKRCQLVCCDFETTIDKAKQGDLIFVDPPYTVKHNFNGFVKYNQGLFTWDDQVRLRDCLQRAATRGCKILVTNAHHKSILDLYKDCTRVKLKRASVISGLKAGRGIYEEVLIAINLQLNSKT